MRAHIVVMHYRRGNVKEMLKFCSCFKSRVRPSASNTDILHHPRNVKELTQVLNDPATDPNYLNVFGNGALHILMLNHYRKKSLKYDLLYAYLTESDIDINLSNQAGNTALHFACEKRDIHIVKLLLAFGANINQLNLEHRTPLDMCTERHDLFCKKNGSSENLIKNRRIKRTATSNEELARFRGSDTDSELVRLLRECDAVSGSSIFNDKRNRRFSRRRNTISNFVDVAGISTIHMGVKRQNIRNSNQSTRSRQNTFLRIAEVYYALDRAVKTSLTKLNSSISPHDAVSLGCNLTEMKLIQKGGSRILFLDSGAIRSLLEIEMLCQIEHYTGRRIIELFDWIVGTSTGAIIAMALVYKRATLKSVRRLFFKMKNLVFGKRVSESTEALTKLYKEEFGSMKMEDVTFPRLLVSSVNKQTTDLKLHFFSNNPLIDPNSKGKLLWKVARYASAGTMFDEMDGYVDGAILASNPCAHGLTAIQNIFLMRKLKLPIAAVVSIGAGKKPRDELHRTDSHQFITSGKHWFNIKDRLMSRRNNNLVTLMTNAFTEAEHIAANVKSRCDEQGIDFYRVSPLLSEMIVEGETDTKKLIDMILLAKKCTDTKLAFGTLALRFMQYYDANRETFTKIGIL